MSVGCGTWSDMSDMSDKSDFIGVPQVQKKRLQNSLFLYTDRLYKETGLRSGGFVRNDVGDLPFFIL